MQYGATKNGRRDAEVSQQITASETGSSEFFRLSQAIRHYSRGGTISFEEPSQRKVCDLRVLGARVVLISAARWHLTHRLNPTRNSLEMLVYCHLVHNDCLLMLRSLRVTGCGLMGTLSDRKVIG